MLLKNNPAKLQLLQPQRRQQIAGAPADTGILQLLMSLPNTVTTFLCNRDAAQITLGTPHTPTSSTHHVTRKGYLLHAGGTLQLLWSWRFPQHIEASCPSSPNKASPQHNPMGAHMSWDRCRLRAQPSPTQPL